MIQLGDVVRKHNLVYAMAIYPPTTTFKREHDGVGNLDKNVIRQAELAETGRYPQLEVTCHCCRLSRQ